MNKIHIEFSDVSSGIGCFGGIFSLQIKDDSWPYQAPRRVVFVLQEPLKEELERLQKQQIIVPLGMDETLEWCNIFVLVPNVNGRLELCLDLARLNKALISPVHRDCTLNHILLRLAGINYLSLINACPGYQNLKLDENSLYLTTFPCPFHLFRSIPNVFGIADNISIVGFPILSISCHFSQKI